MYWPVGTPRIYATTNQVDAEAKHVVSGDGVRSQDEIGEKELGQLSAPEADQPPKTPVAPQTPGISPIDEDDLYNERDGGTPGPATAAMAPRFPVKDPILALSVSRTGHIFVAITATSITVWQVKPTAVLALVIRSEVSLQSYGTNLDVFLRPDTAIIVVRTSSGYLVTYSVATDAESHVYKPHFPTGTNTQRRRQSHWTGDLGQFAPDQIMWGPGEGRGVQDVSIRFRMVIKVDAGISSALALDEEVLVATRKPAAVQCIRWTPDERGQTSTELLSKMSWIGGRKAMITEVVYERSMNLATWVTADGRAYAVQRTPKGQPNPDTGETDTKKLFKGHCFHEPGRDSESGIRAVINPKFSLIALGCADGSIRVYSVMDYAGRIPESHIHHLPVSKSESGALTVLIYSPDGYCLFAGFENGWAMWSVYGKPLSNSFGLNSSVAASNGEQWLQGVRSAAWIGGGSELLLVGRESEALWVLEMARSAVTGCYSSPNLFRTVLQTTLSVMIYRGYDLPDMSSISAEPFLWHTARIPPAYLLNQWPIRSTVISADGRYLAVAGRRGLAHYSVNSGRWKTFSNPAMENEFQVRGGMSWYQNILVAAIEMNKSYELRLFSRERDLDSSSFFHVQQIPAPIILITPSGEDALLVYAGDNVLYHFVFVPMGNTVKFVQFGRMSFHGIVRAPARIRGISWIVPETQLSGGDPSQDISLASVLILVDGKLVLLRPATDDQGHFRLDMRVVAHNVEYFLSMRDLPSSSLLPVSEEQPYLELPNEDLSKSLWVFEGSGFKMWTDVEQVLQASEPLAHREIPAPVSIPLDFYPLSVLYNKAIILGVEPDLVQRRDISFSFFRFSIRTQLILPDILRHHLTANDQSAALLLARQYQHLAYFAHALEILLHHVLDEEVDTTPPPAPEDAILPRVLTLLSSFKQYLDIVVQCTRKTEVRSWRTLFAYLPPAQELFEESLARGSLKTAGGYLLILHSFDEGQHDGGGGGGGGDDGNGGAAVSEQSVRLLKRAMAEGDWDLCKELARFLAAMDESGDTLRGALAMVDIQIGGGADQVARLGSEGHGAAFNGDGDGDGKSMNLLQVPIRSKRSTNGSG